MFYKPENRCPGARLSLTPGSMISQPSKGRKAGTEAENNGLPILILGIHLRRVYHQPLFSENEIVK